METYIAESIVPSELQVMEPAAVRINFQDDADMFGVTPDHVYAYRLLDVSADIYSRWFLVMKSAISRERVRQRVKREDSGLSAGKKMPYERPVLTAAEESTVAMCWSMVKSLFDPRVADYAMLKFRNAMDTGDKRSFKIRLLVLKSRDSLKGTKLYKGFSDGAEECISNAERMAGCVPDPSPRRMSKSEQEKARARSNRPSQPTLFDVEHSDVQLIPINDKVSIQARDGSSTPASVPVAPADPHCQEPVVRSAGAAGGNIHLDKSTSGTVVSRKKTKNKPVTVTKVKIKDIVRKTKIYSNISDIVYDIRHRLIVPYQTNEEIIKDVKCGIITPAEAVLFLSELMKRRRSSSVIGEAVSRDIDNKLDRAAEEQTAYRGRIPVSEVDEEADVNDEEYDFEGEPDPEWCGSERW